MNQPERRKGLMKRRRRMGEGGQAMVEFAIVFPLLLALVTTIIQFALMYNAKAMCNYAAFCCARSATVFMPRDRWIPQIPYPVDGERNEVSWWKRWMKVQMTAAIVLAPISPGALAIGQHIPIFGPFLGILWQIFQAMPQPLRGMLNGFDSFLYAFLATSGAADGGGIAIAGSLADIPGSYGTGHMLPSGRNGGDVVVKVEYVCHLQIPVINRLLGWWWFPGKRHTWSWIFLGKETFWEVSGRCVMPLEPDVEGDQQAPNY